MKKILSALLLILFIACTNQDASTKNSTMVSTEDTAAKKGEWISLFDGKTFNGWHGFNKTGEIKNWMIEDSALVCLGAAEGDTGGDIVTDKEFENFDLAWEWKITTGGNSGVMYHVMEHPKYKAPYETGPEYQVIDDVGFPGKLETWQQAAADYAMNVTNDKKKLKPVGEWNSSRIVFNNGHVEHWLNGEKVLEFQAWDEKWTKEKNNGKWKDFPDYGTFRKGKIALQDHGNKVYFKNILIKEL